ncbi:hypothetical protein GLOIN_2v1519690 [Rhizophagus irregularis DAOM 181602=DAOM 197198]|uniref:Uncharacterized protein n=1 Tax=Rhizophagus irregularis (strain DAOM 181602 / DAOM 197198 / MUCL 43194) TaxID=747089 RepID=A0A2P4QRF6_RHIID|nr:hypothetical protein GLOIN_2v1519690 [Rhizophagus irregularis DAOM 181602=DAOM 197198]POG80236.1 hypothetical protein GLOIN_2v1519690 [Rhizophagus irregularis DAOM 181602=DAOM 197198]|eukprot:XP_025187102.1 hypothetical protein GLOIN_2v1519690 [Rhizophagus irregularis DAOM 181602=DAOM 197198]
MLLSVILESLRLYAFSLWNFLSDELTEKWMYSEVYNYYKNKDNKTLSEVLIKIRKDLKHFSKKELKPHLREKAKNILDNWDVSIELVNQKVLSITIRKRVVLLYFQVPGLRSAGSVRRRNLLRTFLKHQTTCLLKVNSSIVESTECKLVWSYL